jgi:hypothetical protein
MDSSDASGLDRNCRVESDAYAVINKGELSSIILKARQVYDPWFSGTYRSDRGLRICQQSISKGEIIARADRYYAESELAAIPVDQAIDDFMNGSVPTSRDHYIISIIDCL